jgi:hypothetical protein
MTTFDARPLRARRAARAVGAAAALALLGAVFAAYLDPQLVFALANRAWACL